MDTDDLDFFLLDIAVRYTHELYDISWDCDVPPYSRRELIAALLELQAAGDVRFSWKQKRLPSATADELEAGMVGALPLHYGLTRRGGERWARLCGIDWRLWVERDRSLNDDSTSTNTITTGDRDRADFWLEVARRWEDVIPESVTWDEVRPWLPVYWHDEPVGLRVSYVARDWPEGSPCLPSRPCVPSPRPAGELSPRRLRELPARPRQVRKQRPALAWRVQFASALQEASAGIAAQELQQWLGYPNELRRYAAARELGARREQEAVPALLRAVFSHGDVAAVEALEKTGDASCLAPLVTLFEHGEDLPQSLLDTIGRTIAGFGDAGVTALLPLADRFRGLRALAHTRSPQAVEAARAQLGGRLNWVAEDILIAMGTMSRVRFYRGTVDQVEPFARSEDWRSRLQALELLRCCVDPKQGAGLMAELRDDPDVVVRYCARMWSS